MCGRDDHVARAGVLEYLDRAGNGAAGVDHVVDQHAGASRDVTDHTVGLHLVGHQGVACLVDEGQRSTVERVGPLLGDADTSGVGGDHGDVLGAVLVLDVLRQLTLRVHVVDRSVEEALDLVGVQVDRDDAVGARGLQQIGNQASRNGFAPTMFLVLTRIRVERQDGGDALGRPTLEGVDHDQLFHQVLVQGIRAALEHKSIRATDRLLETHEDLTVREVSGGLRGDLDVEFPGDRVGQLGMCTTREQHEALLVVGGGPGH